MLEAFLKGEGPSKIFFYYQVLDTVKIFFFYVESEEENGTPQRYRSRPRHDRQHGPGLRRPRNGLRPLDGTHRHPLR